MKTYYPLFNNEADILPGLQEISRLREIEDLPDFDNLPQIFVSGRTTQRVPATPLDVADGDTLGDIVINPAGTFQYELVDVGGTPKWSRTAINTSW